MFNFGRKKYLQIKAEVGINIFWIRNAFFGHCHFQKQDKKVNKESNQLDVTT